MCCMFISALMTDGTQHQELERVRFSLMQMHDVLYKMSLHMH